MLEAAYAYAAANRGMACRPPAAVARGSRASSGGLGTLLFMGVSQGNSENIIAGGLEVSVLGLAANAFMRAPEKRAL